MMIGCTAVVWFIVYHILEIYRTPENYSFKIWYVINHTPINYTDYRLVLAKV